MVGNSTGVEGIQLSKPRGGGLELEPLEERTLLSQAAGAPSLMKPTTTPTALVRKAPSKPAPHIAGTLSTPVLSLINPPGRPAIVGASAGGRTRAMTVTWRAVLG